MVRAIYVGDSGDIIKRIRTNHCSGNVEGSAFRKHVAAEMGYAITKTKRDSGSTKVRLDLPDPRVGERRITNYLRSGSWRIVICDTYDEAHDFQWYAIAKLQPTLNKAAQAWDSAAGARYAQLLQSLLDCTLIPYADIGGSESGPGVYAFYHNELPGDR